MANLEIKTATRYIEVFLDGVFVSRHLTVEDAIESAVNRGNGDYRIVYPERLVKVYGILNPLTGDTQAPTVPGNPQLVSKGATFVTLSWAASTDNIGVTGYQIRRNGAPAGTTVSTSYTDSGRTPSTQYSYTVEAYDAAGNNSGTAGQTPLVTTTNANSAPVWNAPQQELTTNVSYNLALTSVCSDADTNPLTFAQVSGTLPTGVTFNAGSGIVSGTPTTVQSPSVTFSASDGIAAPVNQAIVFNVLNPDVTAPNVPTLNTPTSVTSSAMTVTANATTDPTVANARTSGVATYTLQRATDSGFTTGVVTQSPQAGTTWNLTGLSASTQYWFRARATDAAGNVSAYGSSVNATTQTTGYTPSHYVAPYTSVPGASDDFADLGATSYSNATSSGTPTTLGTAMLRRTGNQKVRVAPGVYVGSVATLNRFTPSFGAANPGNSASDMGGFFAQYPAAYNYGSTSLYTEVRNNGTTANARPVLGPLSGADHVFFDGFYVNEVNSLSGASAGVFQIANGTRNVQFRRCAFDRQGASYAGTSGYNANAIYIHTCYDPVVTDCYFTGRITYPSNSRQASDIEVYDTTNYLLKNNTHYNTITGEHIKENRTAPFVTAGSIQYNLFNNVDGALVQQQGENNVIQYNLVYGMTSTARYALEFSSGPVRPNKLYNINHNTFIISSGASGWGFANQEMATTGNLFQNNLMYATTDHTGRFTSADAAITMWNWTYWTINSNFYYAVNGGNRWTSLAPALLTTLSSWQSHTGGEGSSISGQDPLFVNAAANNYRLQGGSPAQGMGCYVTGTEEIGMRANPTY